MFERSTGTVTFLFTDIEGSTALLRGLRDRYGEVLAVHHRLLRTVFEEDGGEEIDTQGDAFLVAFRTATDAVRAAVRAQLALRSHPWPEGVDVRIRIGIHTGEARLEERRYLGLSVHRGARISAVGHGGQILVSQTTHALLEDEEDELPDVAFRNLGDHRLKDFDRPIRLYQVLAPGLPQEFPPLRTGASRRRRLRLAAAGGVVAAAALAVGLASVLMGGGGAPAPVVEPNSLVEIDPSTGRVLSVIAAVRAPGAVVYSAGSLWVLSEYDRTIARVDPETGNVTTLPSGLDNPCCLATQGASGIWVSGYGTREVVHVDAITSRPDRVVVLDGLVHGSGDLTRMPRLQRLSAVGGGSLWFLDPYTAQIRRVSPRTGRTAAEHQVEPLSFAVSYGGDSAWISSYGGDSVVEIRSSDGVSRTISVPGGPAGTALGGRALWVNSWSDGRVRRVALADGAATDIVETGQGPAGNLLVDIAVGFGAVWATFGEGAVIRIDVDTPGDVTRIELGHRAGLIAIGGGGVWVTVQEAVGS